jgi:malate dehydrogenase (oxaloacetate-decarboxylating)(NADP+)
MAPLFTKEEALAYHAANPAGKMETIPIKPAVTQKHLSMAYSPGVAEACWAISKNPDDVYKYTNKGNLVAVVSNGSAILGIGNLGGAASKPVMEGKCLLFKIFGDVNGHDICLDAKDPELIIKVCKALEPTYGGINLEDIKAPECFYIEETLKKEMNIPVFHDDQHGTAIITGGGFINALDITGKKAENVKLVVSGAGAAAIATCRFYMLLGLQKENIAMFDTKGHIHTGRTDLNEQKKFFAQKKAYANMAEAFKGADMFLGLSDKGLVSKDMVKSMGKNPILFAMANPNPEITYTDAKEARPDAIMGTGRSDFPNQINNVSGFPYIFRGAFDVRAKKINDEMKMAAAKGIAALAKEPVPQALLDRYGLKTAPKYGIDYVVPLAMDPRLLVWESPAVAKAAMDTGVAQIKLDIEQYKKDLTKRMEASQKRIADFVKSYNHPSF